MELSTLKTFYSERCGLVTLEDDVLSIVRQVRELYGKRIVVSLDETTGNYVFSENCEDGTERLVFVCDTLDARALERLQNADSRSPAYEDAYDRAEREQDEATAARDEELRTRVSEPLERLIHSQKKSGDQDRLPTTVGMYTGRRSADDDG
jgi:hypothetical protein